MKTLDYTSVIDFIMSDKYVDKTDLFDELISHRYVTLENCKGTGSSLFLKTLAFYLDETIDSRDIFRNMKVADSPSFLTSINSYRVLLLDFSDFNATTYDSSIEYLRRKMSDAYRQFYACVESKDETFFDYRFLEDALDIIEMKSSIDVLQRSLRRLILKLRGYEVYSNTTNLCVLIDNLVRLEDVAYVNGYSSMLNQFLKSFIVEDIYKYCNIFLQIGDSKEGDNRGVFFHRHLAYCYFSVFPYDVQTKYKELVVAEDKQSPSNVNISIQPNDLHNCISSARKLVQQAKDKEERDRVEYIRREKLRYAKNLSLDIALPSPNLGIREKRLDKNTKKYAELNAWLKEAYEHCCPDFSSDRIYHYMLKIDSQAQLIHITEEKEALLSKLSEGALNWKEGEVNSNSGCWIQIIYPKEGECQNHTPANPENLKVYASMRDTTCTWQVFVDSMSYLLHNANEPFAAKVSTISRADQMCYWISHNDFVHLEDFFIPYFTKMDCKLPFVAYKGMLGVSKDFPGYDISHNRMQANIIADYFKTVESGHDIELEAMYNNYIAKWNADIYEECHFGGFKNNSALSFVVIMDTLDILLSNSELSEDSLLMTKDKRLWSALSESRCWADVNKVRTE